MSLMQDLESWQQIVNTKKVINRSHIKAVMDIDEISDHMKGKQILDIEVEYDNNTLILTMDDGSIIEMVIDTIYAELPNFDS